MAAATTLGRCMKTLLILRHGKAQPDAPRGDHARELIERGRLDTTAMGAHILAVAGMPDAVITSDTARALQTAELAAEATGFPVPLTLEPAIYEAGPRTLLALVRKLPDQLDSVLLVGHNPGFEELADALSGRDGAVTLPTAGLAILEFDVASWDEAREGTGRLREVATRHTIA